MDPLLILNAASIFRCCSLLSPRDLAKSLSSHHRPGGPSCSPPRVVLFVPLGPEPVVVPRPLGGEPFGPLFGKVVCGCPRVGPPPGWPPPGPPPLGLPPPGLPPPGLPPPGPLPCASAIAPVRDRQKQSSTA